jgi:transposase
MAMGRAGDRQGDLMVTWAEMPRSPGHVFYDRLQEVLIAGGFDRFVERVCQPYYAATMGAPSVPPGRYFRMHMVGYFEGIASERVSPGGARIRWRCAIFCGWRAGRRSPTIRGCRRRASGFLTKSTRRSSAGC